MSRAARSMRWFAIYLAVLGVILVFVPNLLLSAVGFPETREVWIRVLGVLVFNIGVYYWYAASSEAVAFFRASVATRTVVLAAFLAFAALGLVSPVLILFGGVDFAAGLWTAWAIREDQRLPAPALGA